MYHFQLYILVRLLIPVLRRTPRTAVPDAVPDALLWGRAFLGHLAPLGVCKATSLGQYFPLQMGTGKWSQGRDHYVAGIAVLYRKYQWDNLAPGLKIYY